MLGYGGFLKWWYPTTSGFPTKNDHFGMVWAYHHLRKHPYRNEVQTSPQIKRAFTLMNYPPWNFSHLFPVWHFRRWWYSFSPGGISYSSSLEGKQHEWIYWLIFLPDVFFVWILNRKTSHWQCDKHEDPKESSFYKGTRWSPICHKMLTFIKGWMLTVSVTVAQKTRRNGVVNLTAFIGQVCFPASGSFCVLW